MAPLAIAVDGKPLVPTSVRAKIGLDASGDAADRRRARDVRAARRQRARDHLEGSAHHADILAGSGERPDRPRARAGAGPLVHRRGLLLAASGSGLGRPVMRKLRIVTSQLLGGSSSQPRRRRADRLQRPAVRSRRACDRSERAARAHHLARARHVRRRRQDADGHRHRDRRRPASPRCRSTASTRRSPATARGPRRSRSPPGTQLLHAVATDAQGNVGKESRAVVVGPLQPIATAVPQAITAAMSAQTFDAIGRGVTGFLQTGDLEARDRAAQPGDRRRRRPRLPVRAGRDHAAWRSAARPPCR